MDLSIIIVNYKSPQLVLSCLETIYNETKIISFEIIIVDNDSKDDSRQIIQQHYPNVQWIQMDYNSGFARANNAGIRNAKGEFLLLLNSDTLILENALDKIVSYVRKDNSVAAASVQLLYADYTAQNAGNYFVYGGLNVLLTLPVLNNIVKKIGKILKLTFGILNTCTEIELRSDKQFRTSVWQYTSLSACKLGSVNTSVVLIGWLNRLNQWYFGLSVSLV